LLAYAEFFERLIPFATRRICKDDISTARVETDEAICRRHQDGEATFAEIEKLSPEDIGLIDLADYWKAGLVAFTIATARPSGSIHWVFPNTCEGFFLGLQPNHAPILI